MGFSIYNILSSPSDSYNNDILEEDFINPLPITEAEDDDFDIDTSLNDSDDQNNQDQQQEEQPESDNTQQDQQDDSQESDQQQEDQPESDNTQQDTQEDDSEPNEVNTSIFDSLTSEEQSVKIKELQKLYGEMYISLQDINDRLNKLDTDEDNIYIISRLSNIISDLRSYIADYMFNIFSTKSFIENDIMYNRLLSIIYNIGKTLDKFRKQDAKRQEEK